MISQSILAELAQECLEFAVQSVQNGGGPFAALIVDSEGHIVARGNNLVTLTHDPTAHAEMVAIRNACNTLQTFQLTNYYIITSCEPCPMCLGASYWSRVKGVYYIAGKEDASAAGFDDGFIYKEIPLSGEMRSIPFIKINEDRFNAPFEAWDSLQSKILY